MMSRFMLGWVVVSLGTSTAALAQAPKVSSVVWDVAEMGLFRRETKPVWSDGRAVVPFDGNVACPTGLEGVGTVLTLRYRVDRPETYWFHLAWHPGGSGVEQFEVLFNGVSVGVTPSVDAEKFSDPEVRQKFRLTHKAGVNEIAFRFLSGDGAGFRQLRLSSSEEYPQPLRPALGFPTLALYEKELKAEGIMLDSDTVRMYAPKKLAKDAETVFPYLVKAYEELHRITGVHTHYRMVVFGFPEGSEYAWGGTSECAIYYGFYKLDSEDWRKYGVPGVSGYVEEMAHNFVAASGAHFGWEMTGTCLSETVVKKVAGNPVHTREAESAHKVQAATFKRYRDDNNTFPKDIAFNLADRIHAHILNECQKARGPDFWPAFFREIAKRRGDLAKARAIPSDDEKRNYRYRIAVDCYDQVMGGKFKPMLREAGISLTTDVKSLHPDRPGWNRKLQ